MSSYGYMTFKFQVHRIARPDEPLRLGTLTSPDIPGNSGTDALRLLYGLLHGLLEQRVQDSKGVRHLQLNSLAPAGRSVRFTMDLGRSGQESQITDPGSGEGFRRTQRHIEEVPRRGLLVCPDHSVAGLLVLEANGRTTGRQLLSDELRRGLRSNTDPQMIIDFQPAVDGAALAAYLEQAKVNAIRLRRYKLPKDTADQLEMEAEELDAGELDTFVRGPIKRSVLRKLQDNTEARKRMLTIGSVDYDEASVQVQVGGRSTTIDITSERAPRFITVLSSQRPDDATFYQEVERAVPEIGAGLGVRLGAGWATEPWLPERQAYIIRRPTTEGTADESSSAGQ